MSPPSKQQVLQLYKHLLKYGRQLRYTDKNLFLERIRSEFQENKNIDNTNEIEFNFRRGQELLKKRSVI